MNATLRAPERSRRLRRRRWDILSGTRDAWSPLNRIYTRTGDKGLTRLSTGQPVSKASLRVEAYGGVDETNAFIGVAAPAHQGRRRARRPAGAHPERPVRPGRGLGAPPSRTKSLEWEPLRVVDSQVERLEREIDAMNARLRRSTSVRPARPAAPASAALHSWPAPSAAAPSATLVELMGTQGEIVGEPALRHPQPPVRPAVRRRPPRQRRRRRRRAVEAGGDADNRPLSLREKVSAKPTDEGSLKESRRDRPF